MVETVAQCAFDSASVHAIPARRSDPSDVVAVDNRAGRVRHNPPVLLLPAGIAERLTPEQLRAILAHELCHVRRRDNLSAAMHMMVEAVFWFHPLVWWIGARLVEERERACDEEVVAQGNSPEAYAEGIVKVCKYYLQSPLQWACGVSGADLRKRIMMIMTERIAARLTPARVLPLAVAATSAVAGPILVGVVRAQSATTTFEVASIKAATADARGVIIQFLPGGGLRIVNVPLKHIVAFAYDIWNVSQLSGGPAWLDSERFDILAKAPTAPRVTASESEGETKLRLQTLLAERFRLAVHRETKELPVYALTVAKGGAKLKESSAEADMGGRPGSVSAEGTPIAGLARYLTGILRRPVLDRTGLPGKYDFKLEWTPEARGLPGKEGPDGAPPPAPDPGGPSIFTALQEQLGLKLEASRGPVELLVIDGVEKPTEN